MYRLLNSEGGAEPPAEPAAHWWTPRFGRLGRLAVAASSLLAVAWVAVELATVAPLDVDELRASAVDGKVGKCGQAALRDAGGHPCQLRVWLLMGKHGLSEATAGNKVKREYAQCAPCDVGSSEVDAETSAPILSQASAPLSPPVLSESVQCPKSDVKVLAHYMIWFKYTKPYPNLVGHWKGYNVDKAVFNVDKNPPSGCNNTERLATWYPPVSGAFASNDPKHIEYDIKLMKEHCIDGIIIDYQQPQSDQDKALFTDNLKAVIQKFGQAGMYWAIMYDTSSQKGWGWEANPTKANSYNGVPSTQVDDDWASIIRIAEGQTYGWGKNYLRDDKGDMMFFAFGFTPLPRASTMSNCPGCAFYPQFGQGSRTGLKSVPGKQGFFGWNEPQKNNDWQGYLDRFYKQACNENDHAPVRCVGVAFAGFRAVYDLGTTPRDANMLKVGLEKCAAKSSICQVVTWNDYNEGTQVQPSYWCDNTGLSGQKPYPNQYLDVIREFKQQRATTVFT